MRSGPRAPLSDLSDLQQPLLNKSALLQAVQNQEHRRPLPPAGRCADLSMVNLPAIAAGSPPAEVVGIKRKRTLAGSLGRRSSTASVTERVGAVDLAGGRAALAAKAAGAVTPDDDNDASSSTAGSSLGRRRSSARRSTSTSRSGLVALTASTSSSTTSSSSSEASANGVGVDDDYNDDVTSYDLMDPSDDHLISEASRAELSRVRKPELIRLWRVAGLLGDEDEDEDGALSAETMRKDELIDGLIDAVRSDFLLAPKPSR
jgi:hypothetical protein